MQYIIDRFEGNFAVCEDEIDNMINIKIEDIPKEAKEGDILIKKDDKLVIDTELTKLRRKKIESMLSNLWK